MVLTKLGRSQPLKKKEGRVKVMLTIAGTRACYIHPLAPCYRSFKESIMTFFLRFFFFI
jgi:hypothetical protein